MGRVNRQGVLVNSYPIKERRSKKGGNQAMVETAKEEKRGTHEARSAIVEEIAISCLD